MGRRVAEEFREAGARYVVLDFNVDAIDYAREHGDLFVEGNGTKDEDLEATGLARAKGLVPRPTRTWTTCTSRSRRARLVPTS